MKLSSKGRYAVMALTDLAKFNTKVPVTLRDMSLNDTGSFKLNLARSARAITAYLPLLDNFIFSAISATYIYPTILVKFKYILITCFLSLNFDRKI